jgi:2-isopropylmalate synthase
MTDTVRIFDTTLRDGEQSPGIALNAAEKVEIARQLERLGVDIIEAGFAISSPGEVEGIRAVGHAVDCVVASLARTNDEDVDAAIESLQGASSPRIHASSPPTSTWSTSRGCRGSRHRAGRRAVARAKAFTSDVALVRRDPHRHRLHGPGGVGGDRGGRDHHQHPDTVGYTVPASTWRSQRPARAVPELKA